MNEFEDRVRSALTSGAQDAPMPDGLASAARGRLRKRRRTTLVTVAAAVVVAAIPVGLAVASGGGRSQPAPPAASESPSPTAEGWRWESYRDVEFQVPEAWGYGNMSSWCIDSDVPVPVVDRPGPVRLIRCSPETGYGVRLGSSAFVDLAVPNGSVRQWEGPDTFPSGSWLSILLRGDVAVSVVTDSQEISRHIAASVRVIAEVDANGCAPMADLKDSGGEPVLDQIDSIGEISVCRYDVDAGPGGAEALSRSARLTGDAAQRLLGALKQAAVVHRTKLGCTRPAAAFLLHLGDAEIWVEPGDDCRQTGAIHDGHQVRYFTAEVLMSIADALKPR